MCGIDIAIFLFCKYVCNLLRVSIVALHSLKQSSSEEVRRAVGGALWQIEGKEKRLEDVKDLPASSKL